MFLSLFVSMHLLGTFMSGMMLGWLALISPRGTGDGKRWMPLRKKPVEVCGWSCDDHFQKISFCLWSLDLKCFRLNCVSVLHVVTSRRVEGSYFRCSLPDVEMPLLNCTHQKPTTLRFICKISIALKLSQQSCCEVRYLTLLGAGCYSPLTALCLTQFLNTGYFPIMLWNWWEHSLTVG